MLGRCMFEKVVTTSKPSYARVYLENIVSEQAGFKICQKFTYYLDFKNKKVTIIPLIDDKSLKYKGSMTRRMKKQYVPVLNIQSKDIAKVFDGIKKCKIKIYKNEIIVEPLFDENEINQSFMNIEDYNQDNLIYYKDYINNAISKGEVIDTRHPLYRINKKELYKLYNEQGLNSNSLDDIFEFNDNPITNSFKEHYQVQNDTPVLKKTLKVLSLFSGIGAFEKSTF